MDNHQKIICAVDFTGEESVVVSKAADLARKYGATLTLLHVIEPLEFHASSAWGAYTWIPYSQLDKLPESTDQKELIKEAHDRLQALGDAAKIENTDHEVTFNINTSEAICEYVKENSADLIVVGSHGRHGLINLFTSTTAESVVNNAPCDVYSVHLQDS